MKSAGRLFIIATALLLFQAAVAAQTPRSKMLAAMDDDWQDVVSVTQVLTLLPDEAKQKSLFLSRSAVIRATRDSMANGTHSVIVHWDAYNVLLDAYKLENQKLKDETARYDADAAAYVAAGGGGTYKADDPKLAMLQAWHARLTAWRERVIEQGNQVRASGKRVDDEKIVVDREIESFLAEWRKTCSDYERDARRYGATAEIDIRIEKMERQLAMDKKALAEYRDRLPGLHEDIEKMALDADQAREDGVLVALDQGIGLALDGLVHNANVTEKATRVELKRVKDELVRYGIRPEHIKKAFQVHNVGPDSVIGIRTRKKMYEDLSLLKDMAGTLDQTMQKKYYEALASCLKPFVKTPILKLAITNFELYSSLLYTGLSWHEARARVQQYSKLADSDLKAIAALSKVYQTHIKQQKAMKEERERRLKALGF